jgi:Predicted unusual protein kinase
MSNSINVRGLSWNHLPLLLKTECCFDTDVDTCNTLQFNTIRRIGSNSVNGRVYEIHDSHGKKAALKIFKDDDNREGKFALLFSDMESPHFPRVFSYRTCPKVILDRDMFQFDNELLYVRDMATQSIDDARQRKRALITMKRDTSITLEGILNIAREHGASHAELSKIFVQDGISMDVLCSELLAGDLAQILLNPTQHIDTMYIIADFLRAYLEMVNRGISHGDMHPGNVLIRITDKINYAVIHDFGTCEYVEGDSIESFQNDMIRFWSSLSILTGDKLKDIPSHFSSQVRQCEDIESLKSCIRNQSNLLRNSTMVHSK